MIVEKAYWGCGIEGHHHKTIDTAYKCINSQLSAKGTTAQRMQQAAERRATALRLRRSGATYRKIGELLGGVSSGRARELVFGGIRDEQHKPDHLDGLSVRSRNCLMSHGFDSREKVIEGINSGSISPGKLINYGTVSHLEVCAWAGKDGA